MKGTGTRDRLVRRDAWRWRWRPRPGMVALAVAVTLSGGCGTPSAHTISRNYGLRGDVPVDPPRAHSPAQDDCAAGGRLFQLYCGSCHNARPLGERPFNNYQVAIAHMRDQAYLTGKEYRQIILFLRRWDNVGPPTPPVEPSPKRLIFSQPVSELRGESPPAGSAPTPTPAPPPPPPGAGPWQQPGAANTTPALQPAAPGVPPAPRPISGIPAPLD